MKGFNKVTLMTAGLALAMAGSAMAFPTYDADAVNNKYIQVAVSGTLYTDDAETIEDTIENNMAQFRTPGIQWDDLKWSNALERIAEVRSAEVAVRLPQYKYARKDSDVYFWQENASGRIDKVVDSKWIFGAQDSEVFRPNGEDLKRMVVNDANAARHSEYEVVMSGFGTDISAALKDARIGQLLTAIETGGDGFEARKILNIGAAAFAPSDGGSFIVLELNLKDKGEDKDVTITEAQYAAGWRTNTYYNYNDNAVADDTRTGNYPVVTTTTVKYNIYDGYVDRGNTTWPVKVTLPTYDTVWADEYKHEDAGALTQLVSIKEGNIARIDVEGDGLTVAAKKYYASLKKGETLTLKATAKLQNILAEGQTGFNTARVYDVTDFANWSFTGSATTWNRPVVSTKANGVTAFNVTLGYGKNIISRDGFITVTGYDAPAAPADDSLKNGDKFTATYQDTAIIYQVTDLAKKEAKVYKVANKSAAAVAVPASVEYSDEDGTVRFKVTAINGNAFKGMKNLETVSIGKNVTTIGRAAFWRDSKLATVIFNGSKTTNIAKNAFGKIAKDAVFTVKNDAEAKAVKAAVGFVSTQTVEQ